MSESPSPPLTGPAELLAHIGRQTERIVRFHLSPHYTFPLVRLETGKFVPPTVTIRRTLVRNFGWCPKMCLFRHSFVTIAAAK